MTIYLSAPPEYAGEAALHGPVSIMAYRMGAGFHLYRREFPRIRPAIMDIDCAGFTGYGPHGILAREIVGECGARRFIGVSLGITSRPTPAVTAFCSVLSRECSRRGIALYLPAEFCGDNDSRAIFDTRPDFPPFETRLRTFAEKLGAERVALELDLAHIDFTISGGAFGAKCYTRSRGEPPSRAVISDDEYKARYGSFRSFRSPRHMSRYVTDAGGGRLHIVFSDDRECVQRKLEYAAGLGVREAFAYYPQIKTLLADGDIYPP